MFWEVAAILAIAVVFVVLVMSIIGIVARGARKRGYPRGRHDHARRGGTDDRMSA